MSRIKFILIDYLILLITNLQYHVALLKRERYAYDDDDKKEIITIVIINLNIRKTKYFKKNGFSDESYVVGLRT